MAAFTGQNIIKEEVCVSEHEQRLSQLSSFSEMGKALTSTLDLKEGLNIVMEKISEMLQPKNWSLLLIDDETNELYFEILVGEGIEKLKELRLKIGEGIAGWVAREGVPLLVPDGNQDPRFSKKAKRYKTTIAMIFFDLDKFKEVNDRHGHINGSKLLAEVANIIRQGLRKVNIACRYGGDEFVIVMPQTAKQQAYQFAEKMRKTISE